MIPRTGPYLVLCIDVPGRLLLGRRLNVIVCAESEFDLHAAASVPTISVSPPVMKVSNILQAASGPLPPVPGSSAPDPVAPKIPLPPASSKTPLPPAPKTPLPPVSAQEHHYPLSQHPLFRSWPLHLTQALLRVVLSQALLLFLRQAPVLSLRQTRSLRRGIATARLSDGNGGLLCKGYVSATSTCQKRQKYAHATPVLPDLPSLHSDLRFL